MDHLNKLYQRVSLEARVVESGYLGFGNQFQKLVEGLLSHSEGIRGARIFSFNSDLGLVKGKDDYMAIRNLTVYRPLHLRKGKSMLEFVKALESALEAQEDIEKRVLAPWRAILANFMTNPSELQRIYDVKDLRNGKLMKFTDLDAEEKNLKRVYDGTASQATDSFGKLYGNYKEWKETVKLVAKMNECPLANNFKSFVDQITELHEMAGRLAENIKSGDERYQASPSALELLTDGSYLVAKELEFLGASGALLNGAAGAIASTTEVLKSK